MDNKHPINHERRQAEGIVAVSEIARRINASLDLWETLDAIVNVATELVPCTLAEIDLWDEDRQALVLQAIRSTPERAFPIGGSFPAGKGYTGWVINHKQSLFVSDVDARQDICPDILPGELPFKSYLGLPLLAGDELIGAIVLVHDEANSFDEDDLHLVEAIAGQAAIAIQNARVYQKLNRQHKEISALYSVAEAVNRPLDLQGIYNSALDSVIEVTGANAAGIRLVDQQNNTLSFAASKGLSPEYVALIQPVRLGEGIAGRVASKGEPVSIADMLALPIDNPEMRAAIEREGIRARLEVPLRSHERVVGTLSIASHKPDAFGQEDIDLLVAIGQYIGIAIENEHLRQDALQEERLVAVGRVATGVAHDLRSPLGGILRSAEFLARPEISQATRRKLSGAIVSLAKRLINTSQQILDYVHQERLSLQLSPCSLPKFLDEVLTVLEVDFSDRGIEVVKDYRYMGKIVMDANRIAQVVYNIAANAQDAMPQGGRFNIQTRKFKNKVKISFTDTGPGVPKQIFDQIFNPFFTFGKRQGAGLGLAIARRIVEQHEGTIQLESQEGHGAAFIVTLPI